MDTGLLIEKLILAILLFVVSLGIAAYSTYFERKLAAWIQDRVGPDRAGPFGILQPIADGVKMFMKEDFTPTNADRWLFILGPGIAMFTALMTSAVIPWGTDITLFGRTIAPASRRPKYWHSLYLWNHLHWSLWHHDRWMGFQ